MTLLKALFAFETLVVLIAATTVVTTRDDFSTVAVFFYTSAVWAVCAVIAMWQALRHKSRVPLSVAIIVMPLVIMPTPSIIKSLAGGPIPPAPFFVAIGLCAFIGVSAWFAWTKTKTQRAQASSGKSRLDPALTAGLATVLVLLGSMTLWMLSRMSSLSSGRTLFQDNPSTGAWIPVLLVLTAIAGISGSFTAIYAPINFFRGSDRKLMHGIQFLLALALLGTVALIVFAAVVIFAYGSAG